MIVTIFILIILTAVISVFEEHIESHRKYIYIVIGVFLIALASTRPVGIDRDSENYEESFKGYNDPVIEKTVEFSYSWLSEALNTLTSDVHSIFLLYALISIPLKLYGITKLSPIWFSSLVIYLSNYYILHELTQIRAGVAAGAILIAIYQMSKGERKKASLLLLFATFFHYSSIITFPMLFLGREAMNSKSKYFWASLIPIGYLFHFLHIGLTTLPIPYIADKMEIYTELRDRGILGDEAINVFNAVFVVKIITCYYLMYFSDTISNFNKAFPLMLRWYFISLFAFIILADMPVFAFRISEIFGIVEIILFSNLYYTVKPDYLSKSIIVVIGLLFFAFNIFQNELLLWQI